MNRLGYKKLEDVVREGHTIWIDWTASGCYASVFQNDSYKGVSLCSSISILANKRGKNIDMALQLLVNQIKYNERSKRTEKYSNGEFHAAINSLYHVTEVPSSFTALENLLCASAYQVLITAAPHQKMLVAIVLEHKIPDQVREYEVCEHMIVDGIKEGLKRLNGSIKVKEYNLFYLMSCNKATLNKLRKEGHPGSVEEYMDKLKGQYILHR